MVTAFVLTGGGSLGAAQVGALQALSRRGIHPDLLIGTSAGSINAAYVAGHGSGRLALSRLAALWTDMRRRDVFGVSPVDAARAALGLSNALCSPAGLARLLAEQLPFAALEQAALPLHVVTTDFLSGKEVLLSDGDAVEALLASCAIPGVFPPVRRDDRLLCDGALAGRSGVAQAARLGADVVYLLTAGTPCALDRAPSHPVAAALHGVTLLLQQHALLETAAEAKRLDLRVIPPLCPLTVSAADFTQARTLIERARKAAGVWIDSGADRQPAPERFLSLHSHPRTRSAKTPAQLAPGQPPPPVLEEPVRAADGRARRPRVRKPADPASRRPAS